jgi:predicted secreted protein
MFRALCVLAALGIGVLVAAGCQHKQEAKSENGGSTAEIRTAAVGSGAGTSKSSTSGSHATSGSHTKSASEPPQARGGSLTLTEIDNGKELHVHPGQTITLVLGSGHANGMEWSMVSPQTPVLWSDAKPVYAAKGSATGTETWRFRAAKAGRQDVRLEYGSGHQSVPERNFRFTVEVQ